VQQSSGAIKAGVAVWAGIDCGFDAKVAAGMKEHFLQA
jgi:hypothetical protein